MEIEDELFIAIIDLIPYKSVFYIQAPDLPASDMSKILQETNFGYYKAFSLDEKSKSILIDSIRTISLTGYIHTLEIKLNDQLLFKGFDGMELGVVSKNIVLPSEFIEIFIEREEMCVISKEW